MGMKHVHGVRLGSGTNVMYV